MVDMDSMTRSEPNLPLLRKVLDIIDAEPQHWDQNWWQCETKDRVPDDLVSDLRGVEYDQAYGKCGTTRCVAGWIQWLERGVVTWDAPKVAQAALVITDDEAQQLFYETSYCPTDEQRERVQRAAEQIAARAGERL